MVNNLVRYWLNSIEKLVYDVSLETYLYTDIYTEKPKKSDKEVR